MHFVVVLLFASVLLSGCSTKPRQGEPAPVISRDGYTGQTKQPARQEGNVVITPLPSSSAIVTKPATHRAVELLQQRAQAQAKAGDMTAAAKSLERALSIQPDNAYSWNLLAHLRAKQSRYAMAAEIAAKSNSMVGVDDVVLKKDNLMLIVKMKSLLGDKAGADLVRQQAMAIN